MNCEEVQERLSDYLEKALDRETAASMDGHLSSCDRCRSEVRNLAESLRLVAALPAVDPPGNFTQSVMARVRDAEPRPKWWERFFFPLTIKVPIHATALVLVAVFAAYLYRPERPAKPELQTAQQAFKSDDNKEHAATSERDALSSLSAQKKNKLADEIAPQTVLPRPESKRSAGEGEEGKTREVQEKISRPFAPSGTSTVPGLEESPKFARGQRAEDSKDEIQGGGADSQRSASLETKTERLAQSAAAAPKPAPEAMRKRTGNLTVEGGTAGSMGTESAADYNLVMKLREDRASGILSGASRNQAAGESFTFRDELNEIERSRRRATESNEPQTLWLSIPRSRYEQFKKDLAAFATVETESRLSSGDKESPSDLTDAIRIKLTILPPASPTSAPSH